MKKLFSILSVLMVLAMLFAACKAPADTPEVETAEEVVAEEAEEVEEAEEAEEAEEEEAEEEAAPEVEAPSAYQEAPMLAAMVEAGDLPPVEERLPEVPFLVGPGVLITLEDMPSWQSGEYGGELQMAHRGDFPPDVFIGSNEGYLAGAGIGIEGVQGNVLESFEVSEDARTFTFKMRKGLKWSDGMPVTREDVEFAWNDVLGNTEIYTGGIPGNFVSPITKNPATMEFLDDWTFTLTFDDPYGSLVVVMAIKGWAGYQELIKPAHYLKDFHKDYADEADLLAVIEAEGYEGIDSWVNLFSQKDVNQWEQHLTDAIGFPRLNGWLLTEMTEGALIYERNPYFYKVDAEGKQLPYIDSIVTARVDDVEMVNMRAIAGQVDFTRESPDIQAIPVYKEQEESGNYTAYIFDAHVNPALIGFNFESTDEAFKEVANILEFRQAINHSIDRAEINDTVYFGLAYPSIATPSTPDVYDVDLANELLDSIGMTEYDDEGFRLTPSGLPLLMYIEQAEYLAEHTTICELLVEYWAEIGLRTQMEIISSDLLNERHNASETMVRIGWAHVPLWATNGWNDWEPSTAEWSRYNNTQDEFEGIAPPPEAQELWDIFEQRATMPTGSPDEQALYDLMMVNYNTYLWRISIFTGPNPLIITNDLCNIPEGGIGIATNYSMEQFYFCPGTDR